MIRLVSVREVKQLSGFEIWYIVRSPKNLRFDETHKHVPELSPNSQLFYSYLNAAKMGDWNAEWFAKNYVPSFLRQMRSAAAQEKLSELVVRSQTENIALVCFCEDERLCHRSIVGGILYNMGAYCDHHIPAAYSKYKI